MTLLLGKNYNYFESPESRRNKDEMAQGRISAERGRQTDGKLGFWKGLKINVFLFPDEKNDFDD